MIRSILDLSEKDLLGKKVLLRVDFNVPVANGKISEFYRIDAVKETVDFLTSRGAIVALLSHITAVNPALELKGGGKSFEQVFEQRKNRLGRKIKFIPESNTGQNVVAGLKIAKPGDVLLLENVRQHKEEEENNPVFAKELAANFDIYVNNAFSVSHRDHASMTGVTRFLSSYGGLLLMKEIENLKKIIEMPVKGKTLILGGAKVGTKLPVIENFLDKADNILIGGVLANIFLKARGLDIGKSIVDDDYLPHAKKFLKIHSELMIPDDFIIRDGMILDIGPKTTARFSEIIKKSKVIVWNGPLGKAEVPELATGTKQIAEAIADSGAFSDVGGGDTIAVLEELGLIKKITYVSPSGGAMLQFLAGKTLPGLEALGYYNE